MPQWAHRNFWKKKEKDLSNGQIKGHRLSRTDDEEATAIQPASQGSLDAEKDVSNGGNVSGKVSLSAAQTKDSAAGGIGSASRPFTLLGYSAESRLALATADLMEASAKLQATLKESRTAPSDAPNEILLRVERGPVPPPLPFSTVVRAAQARQHAKEETWVSQTASFLAVLYPPVKLILGLTGSVASSAGFMPLQVAANGLAQVLEIFMNPRVHEKDIMDGLDDLTQDESFLVTLRRFPEGALDDDIKVGVVDMMTALAIFLNDSIRYLDHHYLLKLLQGVVKPGNVQESKQQLLRARTRICEAVRRKAHLTIIKREITAQQKELLDKIGPATLTDLHRAKQSDLRIRRLSNSAAWFLNNPSFIRWRDEPLETLWCPGLPGAGKTFVSSAIVDHVDQLFEERGIPFAYAFFDFASQEEAFERKLDGLLRSIARQMLERSPDLCHHFEDISHRSYVGITECQNLLERLADLSGHLAVVLDGLDEFSSVHAERLKLAREFKTLHTLTRGRLNLLILTRELPDVADLLQPSEVIAMRADPRDIQAMLASEYDESAFVEDDALRDEVLREITERSDCIFKLAQQQVRYTLAAEMLNATQVRKRLRLLPTKLFDYYEESVRRIKRQSEGPIIIKMLTWLCYAKTPLHMDELSIALSIDEESDTVSIDELGVVHFERLVAASHGLIITRNVVSDVENILPNGGFLNASETLIRARVLLAHETVAAFLQGNVDLLHPMGPSLIVQACGKFLLSDPWCRLMPMRHYRPYFASSIRAGIIEEPWLRHLDSLQIDRSLLVQEDSRRRYDYLFSLSIDTEDIWDTHPNLRFYLWAQTIATYINSGEPSQVELLRKLILDVWGRYREYDGYDREQPLLWLARSGCLSGCEWLLDQGMIEWNLRWGYDRERYLISAVMGEGVPREVCVLVMKYAISTWIRDPAVNKISRENGVVWAIVCACDKGWDDVVLDVLTGAIAVGLELGTLSSNFDSIWTEASSRHAFQHLALSKDFKFSDFGELLRTAASKDPDGQILQTLLQREEFDHDLRSLSPFHTWIDDTRTWLLIVALCARNLANARLILASTQLDLSVRSSGVMAGIRFAIAHSTEVESTLTFGEEGEKLDRAYAVDVLRLVDEMLCQPHIDINEKDIFGRTALSWASSGSTFFKQLGRRLCGIDQIRPGAVHAAFVMKLIGVQNIDLNISDHRGRTPLDYAYSAFTQIESTGTGDWIEEKVWSRRLGDEVLQASPQTPEAMSCKHSSVSSRSCEDLKPSSVVDETENDPKASQPSAKQGQDTDERSRDEEDHHSSAKDNHPDGEGSVSTRQGRSETDESSESDTHEDSWMPYREKEKRIFKLIVRMLENAGAKRGLSLRT